MKKKVFLSAICVVCSLLSVKAIDKSIDLSSSIAIKSPGNPSISYQLKENLNGMLVSDQDLPLDIREQREETDSTLRITITLKAKELVYYNLENICKLPSVMHSDCEFLMPGFWYRRNLRSPNEAPSFHTSDSWQVREDRLSTPLTGIFDEKTGDYYTVLRSDKVVRECLTAQKEGEVILSGKTDLGFTGFRNMDGSAALVFGFPYWEAPKTYIRKLNLAPSVQAFEKLEKGETRQLTWELKKGNTQTFASFVSNVWNYSYKHFQPQPLSKTRSTEEAKAILSNFFKESYVDKYDLKFYSGVGLRVSDCNSTGESEIGFVGRTLYNALDALEYGEANNRPDLTKDANSVFDSFLTKGFTPNGFFRESVNFDHNDETHIYSIRRQSEGASTILLYLDYEKSKGRKHPEWENRLKTLFANFAKLQAPEGNFPRKFDDNLKIVDESGGSTPCATLPLAMASAYFKNKSYLASAKRTGEYLEKELISKSDYFSSTLDANCEDKEASVYASTAMYYLSMVSKGKERQHYIGLCRQASYFGLSWYYLWDVPFAQGQMLGDVNFKTRGWGNVSAENNHVDVYIFEFASVLNFLSTEYKDPKLSAYASVIRSSMLQLLPHKGNMYGLAKVGYNPEVVQHTNWDYGRNGKGFYNDIFATGWTIASLWTLISPNRVPQFFKDCQ